MLEKDPLQSIDTTGGGSLVGFGCEMGCEIAEEQEKAFKLGVCGEHGGDPASIGFFHACGLDYVSCSPLRVPVVKAGGGAALGACNWPVGRLRRVRRPLLAFVLGH